MKRLRAQRTGIVALLVISPSIAIETSTRPGSASGTSRAPEAPVEIEPLYFAGQGTPASVDSSDAAALIAAWDLGGTRDPEYPTNRASFHPAVRVIVDTRVTSGGLVENARRGLSKERVLAVSRSKGYWPFRLCYEAGLRSSMSIEDPAMTAPRGSSVGSPQKGVSTARRAAHREQARKRAAIQGKSLFRFSIGARGAVTFVRRLRSELPDEVTDCLRQAAYGLQFTPVPQRRIDVDLTIRLSPGDAPLPLAPPPTGPGDSALTGMTEQLARLTEQLRTCYRQGLSRDAALWGRIELQLCLDDQGRVIEIDDRASRFPDPRVSFCVKELLERERGKFRPIPLPPTSAAGSMPTKPLTAIAAFRFGHLPRRLAGR